MTSVEIFGFEGANYKKNRTPIQISFI
jgi:hypothetical protein